MNLHDLFAIPAGRTPDKTAIQFPVEAQSAADEISYAQLHDAANRLAAGLQEWGLQKGDRVAFYIGSRPEFVIAYLAVLRLGAIMVPINLRYRRLEIGHILADCTPRLLVTEHAHEAILSEIGDAKESIEAVVYAEELASWQQATDTLNAPIVEADDQCIQCIGRLLP